MLVRRVRVVRILRLRLGCDSTSGFCPTDLAGWTAITELAFRVGFVVLEMSTHAIIGSLVHPHWVFHRRDNARRF